MQNYINENIKRNVIKDKDKEVNINYDIDMIIKNSKILEKYNIIGK